MLPHLDCLKPRPFTQGGCRPQTTGGYFVPNPLGARTPGAVVATTEGFHHPQTKGNSVGARACSAQAADYLLQNNFPFPTQSNDKQKVSETVPTLQKGIIRPKHYIKSADCGAIVVQSILKYCTDCSRCSFRF